MLLDSIDWKILALLQSDARMSNVELARAVGLSPSPCLARVRALEQAGYISRYVSLLDALKVGLKVSVFIQVALEKQVEKALEVFENAILERPEVMECSRCSARHPGARRVYIALPFAGSRRWQYQIQFRAETGQIPDGAAVAS
jgi:DNA-binding Lrp family transcriptional regulator